MPVTVVVRSASGGEAPSLTFDGGRIVIGRSDGSDVRLPDPSVSLRHASIRAQGAEYALVDEGSTNGTWVGGVKLGPHTPRLVKSGDLVRVGRVWLELVVGHKAPTPDLGLATRDLALALVRNAMDAMGDDTRAVVRVAEGPDMGAELRLVEEGRDYVIGRAESCDLPLADEDASREHAAVVRRGAQILLRDLGSRNGVYLGDARLGPEREVVWRPPTMARVGASVLALDEPVSLALAELEAAADEPLPDAEAPPEPPPSTAAPSSAAAHAPPASAEPPGSRISAHADAPIAEIASRTAPTVIRRPRRVWTAADVMVVTIAVAVISASIAGLVWVLR
ncbi:MAG: FHA domain-containing protein [Labilithrix sp.]|nr:FHA domain-containing protein [Labilithrix sp.]